jgi:hypothetical protein
MKIQRVATRGQHVKAGEITNLFLISDNLANFVEISLIST